MRPSPRKPLTIGLVARRAGVGVETVRFYERQGLIEDAPGAFTIDAMYEVPS